jgi:hypothetical protein
LLLEICRSLQVKLDNLQSRDEGIIKTHSTLRQPTPSIIVHFSCYHYIMTALFLALMGALDTHEAELKHLPCTAVECADSYANLVKLASLLCTPKNNKYAPSMKMFATVKTTHINIRWVRNALSTASKHSLKL